MFNHDSERISFVDNFWLRQDRPYNHMTISSVMVLAERMDFKRLQHLIETRWCAYPRFKQRPVSHATGIYWETDTHFDIGNHVRRVGLPGTQGKEELEELVSNLVTIPLDPTKPLWDIHLVDSYQGGSAVVWRIHHCYADGIALIHMALSITEKAPDSALTITSPPPLDAQRHKDEEARTDIFRQVLEPVSEALRQAVNTGRDLLGEGVDIALHPAQAVDQAGQGIGTILGYARQGLGFVSEATRLLFLADDPPTCFKGKLGVAKRVAWSDPLPLEKVRLIGKALGATINDILLSCVTGALRSYLLEKGDLVDSTLEIRAAVPVNLRPQGQADKLGNFFGMVLLSLPVGIENGLPVVIAKKTTIFYHIKRLTYNFPAFSAC